MALLRHFLLSFTIIVISFVACSSYFQEDPLITTYVDDDDDGGTLSSKNLIEQNTCGLSRSLQIFNVTDYGAKGDGQTDDTQAFEKAWEAVCSSGGEAVFVAPQDNIYLLKPIRFSGPCKSNVSVQISGLLIASVNPSDYSEDQRHWLVFDKVQQLLVNGGGTLDGKGNIWWENSCKRNKEKPCKDAPTALTFDSCEDLIVENLKIRNAQQIHVSFQDSVNVTVSGLIVASPEDSPNTDGIHVTNTQNIKISNSIAAAGDDCISIVDGSRNVEATNITCGPGHGISIGSLGARKSKDIVSGVLVNGAKISGTANGVRIKTWPGGSGSASNITFQNIEMDNVTNPIIINQNYCDKKKKPCKQMDSAVQISNVSYLNITGTSASDVAVNFDCSKEFPCKEIEMQNIDLKYEGEAAKAICNNVQLSGEAAKAICNNVQLSYTVQAAPNCASKKYTN